MSGPTTGRVMFRSQSEDGEYRHVYTYVDGKLDSQWTHHAGTNSVYPTKDNFQMPLRREDGTYLFPTVEWFDGLWARATDLPPR